MNESQPFCGNEIVYSIMHVTLLLFFVSVHAVLLLVLTNLQKLKSFYTNFAVSSITMEYLSLQITPD